MSLRGNLNYATRLNDWASNSRENHSSPEIQHQAKEHQTRAQELIMPKLKNFSAYVTVNGQRLAEFNDDDEDNLPSNTVSKFLETVTGAEFRLEFRDEEISRPGCDGMRCTVSLDGKAVDATIMEFRKFRTAFSVGPRTSNKGIWTLKKYCFKSIIIAEQASDSSTQDMKKLIDDLGTITVQVHRVKNIRTSISGKHLSTTEHVSSKPIPAKYLKGLAVSHKASLGPPQTLPPVRIVDYDQIDPTDCPYAVFKFKYRSRSTSLFTIPLPKLDANLQPEDLQDLLIIPRPATPVPLEERPKNELTREELLELLNRHPIQFNLNRSAQVKREALPPARVKRERDIEYDELISTAKTRKVTNRTEKAIEVIDLLD
ncbi:MAG: hypothetical protein Q9187_000944 [Circinaria calcarea]